MVLSCLLMLMVFLGCGDEVVEDPNAGVRKAPAKVSGDANVTEVFAREEPDGTWTFHVGVTHNDVNWYDYADGWNVVLPDGSVVKPDPFSQFTRALRHPHVEEQPFVRTQKGIVLPEGVDKVTIRAHDKKHGWGGEEVIVDLNVRFGEKFSVKRRL